MFFLLAPYLTLNSLSAVRPVVYTQNTYVDINLDINGYIDIDMISIEDGNGWICGIQNPIVINLASEVL
jgi:hypothetical protein